MELKKTIDELFLPAEYLKVINQVNLERTNDFVKAILNTIINKYGVQLVKNAVDSDDSNSEISTSLTHIIEVGGLKVIAENKLDVNSKSDFPNIIYAVVFILNCSLAIELKNLSIYDGPTSNYYGNEAIKTIAQRLATSTWSGMNYKNGFEHYSNNMVYNYLIN
jgi:hypothetical protein